MNIAVLPNLSKAGAKECTLNIIKKINSLCGKILVLNSYYDVFAEYGVLPYANIDNMIKECDFLITIGGDGTIIHAAKHAALQSKPVLGVNLGRVGFVAELESNEIDSLKKLFVGDFSIQERIMLCIKINDNVCKKKIFALNDAVISRSSFQGIVDLNVKVNNNKMNEYRADGVIVATPTGSTAYSLSAHGPIIDPEMNCVLLTPICSHSLFSRPVIFKETSKLLVSGSSRDEHGVLLTVDGEESIELLNGQEIEITVASKKAYFVKLKDKDFYDVLNEKLSGRIT